jgi:hypothetical protein
MNWANYSGLRPAGCLPCCTPTPAPPVECACALLIPITPFITPGTYADYATAEAAISDLVVSCMVYHDDSPFTFASYTATFTTTLDVSWSIVPVIGNSCGANGWASISLAAGSTLDVGYSVANTGVSDVDLLCSASATVYECDGTPFAFDSTGDVTAPSISGTFSFPITDAGEYWVLVGAQAADDGGSGTATTGIDVDFVISSDDVMLVNPVIALWDDSGTTRQLEACPKMLLPIGTEVVGDWYADETAASDVITSLTRDCCAYFEAGAGIVTFTASGVNTDTLSFTADVDAGGANGTGFVYASVMAEAGESITLAWTGSVDSPLPPELLVLDTSFSSVGSDTGTSPLVVSSLPYAGRYIVRMLIGNNIDSIHVAATLTSSGTMLVLPIQALYDAGLDCPSRLDCS